MNFEDNSLNQDLLRRLNEIAMKQRLRDAEDFKLSEFESLNLKEFFEIEIKAKSLKEETEVYEQMFRDIQDPLLKNYFINSITKNKL
jgi:hypothetical protein